jgi:excinuclease ABC subunit C
METEEKYERYPNEIVKDKVENLTTKPGIYQYFNEAGKIIYVGKAKNLKNRVKSYFQQGRVVDAKTKAMTSKIADMDYIIVDSEVEALILEDTLIKKYKPRYNVLLRDDKTYPYIRITNEPYPKIYTTRKVIKDGSKYFGPYTDVRNLKHVMKIIRHIFMLRSCELNITDESIRLKKHKICLDYHIQKCEGPCEGLISKDQYRQNINHAIQILNGKTRDVEKQLEAEMQTLSDEMKFEHALVVRNRLSNLREYSNKQKMVSIDMVDRDVFGLARIDDTACTLILKIRDGKLIGKRHFIIKNALELTEESIIQRAVEQCYLESDFIPKEIFLPNEVDDMEYLTDWLAKLKGKTVEIYIPKIGDKRKTVEMASTNAEFLIREYNLAYDKREQVIPRMVLSLQRDLRMDKPPLRMECFDNSHIQGSELVSSLVVFEDGKPKKSDYRKFKTINVLQNDDFAAMRETVHRRYKRLIEENLPLPDLIVIDGGKGQLSSACSVLEELGIMNKVKVIGLAKKLEEVFFPNNPDSLLLPKTSSSLRLLQQIRDEAHRFAITFHRSLRDKRTLKSELDDIKGIGKKTAQKLLIEFGSVQNIKNASEEELLKVVSKKIVGVLKEKMEK